MQVHTQTLEDSRDRHGDIDRVYRLLILSADTPRQWRLVTIPNEARMVRVGRSGECGLKGSVLRVALPDKYVSQKHLELIREAGGWRLRHCSGKNGTHLNGERVEAVHVPSLAVIDVGLHTLMVCEPSHEGSVELAGLASVSALRPILESLAVYAPTKTSILLTGETGTGKGVMARAIHAASGRGAYVDVNCPGVAPTLAPAAFFGTTRGAYTGAEPRDGYLMSADGGTLFLDEIGDLSLDVQVQILKAIETGEVRPVGGTRPRRSDFRVMAATNRDLHQMVRDGSFREDLYYRIAQHRVHLPPARERRPDVGLWLARALEEMPDVRFARRALSYLLVHDWPGNLRQFATSVRLAATAAQGRRVTVRDLATCAEGGPNAAPLPSESVMTGAELRRLADRCQGNVARMATQLGVSRRTVGRRAQALGIDLAAYRPKR